MHAVRSIAPFASAASPSIAEGLKNGRKRVYTQTRMYGANMFGHANLSTHLRGLQPTVIAFDGGQPKLLHVDVGSISGPPKLGPPAKAREMGIFNPSIASAPPHLCPRCAYVAALRVDPLHQCHDQSPLLHTEADMPKGTAANAWFKGTVIIILDDQLLVLGWTWLLNAPQHQVSYQRSPSRWFVPQGSSDGFPPPWAKAVYDVRVVSMDDRLFVSYVCRRCDFSIAQLQLTADVKPDGSIHKLRAWQSHRYGASHLYAAWAQGRNQALFKASPAPGRPAELMVQPWLGVIGSFGAPVFQKLSLICARSAKNSHARQPAGSKLCGATPLGTNVDIQVVANNRLADGKKRFGLLKLVANNSQTEITEEAVGGFRLSTTSNLVNIIHKSCSFHLGVGHLHRSEGERNILPIRRQVRNHKSRGIARNYTHLPQWNHTFKWGYRYTHFFYAIEAHAPFRVLATSGEFCFESVQQAGECESIQFVSGILLEHKGGAAKASTNLLLSYGVNDCEAKVGRILLSRTWEMLKPLSWTMREPNECAEALHRSW